MDQNRLSPADKVSVAIAVEGRNVGNFEGTGFSTVGEAVTAAYEAAGADHAYEDCVFTVRDESTGTHKRYRINAHGHLKLIPEEP